MEKLILCGLLFDAVSTATKQNMAIIIGDNTIIDIRDAKKVVNIKKYEIIDLSSSFVMPGLIDAHVHINMNGEEDSDRLFLYRNASEIALNSMKNVQSDLVSGFTTLRDVGSVSFSDVAVKNAINSGQYQGPRMQVCGWSISPPGGSSDSRCAQGIEGNHPHGRIVNGVPEVLKAVRENFKYGADAIKLMITNTEGCYMSMTYEEMAAAISVAKAYNATICAHASGNDSIKNAVRAGITSIEHGNIIDEEGAQMMKDYGVFIVPTLMATSTGHKRAKLRLPSEDAIFEKTKLESIIDLYKTTGVKICFGSDAAIPYIAHGKQSHEFELLVEFGLSPEEALISATKTNAELLRWDDKIGTIETGKFADIVAFKENPLVGIKAMNECIFVMKDGVIIKNTG